MIEATNGTAHANRLPELELVEPVPALPAKRADCATATRAREPYKLSRQVIDKLIEATAAGLTWQRAARWARIDSSTLRRWRLEAEDAPAGSLLAELREGLSWAAVAGEFHLANVIHDAAPKDWRAAAWLLERRHPKQWGKRSADPAPVAPVQAGPSDGDIARAILAERRAEAPHPIDVARAMFALEFEERKARDDAWLAEQPGAPAHPALAALALAHVAEHA